MSNWFWIILQCSQLKRCHVNQSHPQVPCQRPAILKHSFQMEPVLLLDFFAGKQWSVWDILDTVPGTTFTNKRQRAGTSGVSFHCLTLIQMLPVITVNRANSCSTDAPLELEERPSEMVSLNTAHTAIGVVWIWRVWYVFQNQGACSSPEVTEVVDGGAESWSHVFWSAEQCCARNHSLFSSLHRINSFIYFLILSLNCNCWPGIRS